MTLTDNLTTVDVCIYGMRDIRSTFQGCQMSFKICTTHRRMDVKTPELGMKKPLL